MRKPLLYSLIAVGITCIVFGSLRAIANDSFASGKTLQRLNLETQPKVVKIFGVGGFRQLEAYQSGIFVSADGHILTAHSLVLDEGEVTVVPWDGRRAIGKVIGVDPIMELALIKIDVAEPVEYFSIESDTSTEPGARVLAFANLFGISVYDEPVSVLQGVIAGIVPLSARRGAFQANYSGTVYVVDAATNNPGAAGGAVVDLSGRLVGLIGKELRSETTGTWLNYCLPAAALREPVDRMIKGESTASPNILDDPTGRRTPSDFGIVLVPDVLERTPPYLDRVVVESAAARAGLRPDDLLVAVGGRTVASQRDLVLAVAAAPIDKPLGLTVLRGQELVQVSLELDDSQAERNE